MTDDPRDEELEHAFREGLRQAADRTDVGVPLVARAHAGARTRRRRRWAVVGTVAAVVAVSGTAYAVRSGSAPEPDRRPTDHAVTEPTTAAPVAGWRAESWHGLTVDVPADWGWGTAPIEMSFDPGKPVLCGLGAALRPDGTKQVNPKPDTPWVGRPVMLSDACLGQPFPTPEASYVWLGADLDLGTLDLGGGYTQETVEAFGTTLTVGTDDPALRRQIIGSARPQDQCGATFDDDSPPGLLCAYGPAGHPAGQDYAVGLVYATTIPDQDFAAFVRAVETAPEATSDCDATPEYVVMTAPDGGHYVVDVGCGQVRGPDGRLVNLTDAARAPWVRDGIPVVLTTLIGPLG